MLAGITIFLMPNWVFMFVTMGFIAMSIAEFFSIVENRGIFVYKYFGIVAGCVIPLSVYLQFGENYIDMEPILIILACLFTFILQFIRKERAHDHIVSIGVTILALFYISWFFSFFLKLKFLDNGPMLVAYIILVTKIGDVGAYFIGRSLGRHKLIPRISPNKTVEGTIGGLLCSLIMSVAMHMVVGMTLMQGVFVGLFMGVLGQVGDLAESLLKRDCDVKDAGKHVPGFGGMLDVIDSLLFNVPIFYYYANMFLQPK